MYSPTPFGPVLSHCVHEVPSGSLVHDLADRGMRVTAPNGSVNLLPACNTNGGTWPMRQELPPDYDGWLQYTELNVSDLGLSGGFDQFSSVMSVPDHPKEPARESAVLPKGQ